jgi:hypothetical protein
LKQDRQLGGRGCKEMTLATFWCMMTNWFNDVIECIDCYSFRSWNLLPTMMQQQWLPIWIIWLECNNFWPKYAMGTLTRTTIEVFKEWTNKFFKIFVDDVNIHNKIYKDHLSHLKNVLSKLCKVNLNLNLGMCSFGRRQIMFLCHIVTSHSTCLNPTRCKQYKISMFQGLLLICVLS